MCSLKRSEGRLLEDRTFPKGGIASSGGTSMTRTRCVEHRGKTTASRKVKSAASERVGTPIACKLSALLQEGANKLNLKMPQ